MASINRIKAGQTLYDVKRRSGREFFRGASKYVWWPVIVTEVNVPEKYIVASWNGNPAKKMYEYSYKKLRVRKPD